MGVSSILIISLAAGVVLVVGGGLMMYMANLVRSAYEIKVQINNDVDERLTKMAEDLDKKSRWIKRDLLEELDKIKVAFATENANKVQALSDPLLKKVADVEQLLRAEREEWTKAVEADRQAFAQFDTKLKLLRRDLKKVEDGLGVASSPAAGDAPAAPSAPAPAKPTAIAAPAPARAPQTAKDFLPDLA